MDEQARELQEIAQRLDFYIIEHGSTELLDEAAEAIAIQLVEMELDNG